MQPDRATYRLLRKASLKSTSKGYDIPKWIVFCYAQLLRGRDVWVYDAVMTVSKYVYVRDKGRQFKVRFSNHKPSRMREVVEHDCDFFVGVTHTGVRTYIDAWNACEKFFSEGGVYEPMQPMPVERDEA